MRVRLRDAYPDPVAFYAERYPTGYQHRIWPDHVERVAATVAFAVPHLNAPDVIADLSAGDAEIPYRIAAEAAYPNPHVDVHLHLSDLERRENFLDAGPVEETVLRMPYADLLVCSEILEHLDDPEAFLVEARKRAGQLLVTTPEGETDPDQNPEHYWGWDSAGVQTLLITCGWRPYAHQLFRPTCGPYTFQMWMCR